MNLYKKILFLFLLPAFVSCVNIRKDAYEYNNFICDEESKVSETIYMFKAAIENHNHNQLDRLKNEGVAIVNQGIEHINTLENHDAYIDYKNATLDLFNVYLKIYNNEFSEIIDVLKQNKEIILNENTKLKIKNIEKQADTQIQESLNYLKKRQAEFAEKNNLLISSNI